MVFTLISCQVNTVGPYERGLGETFLVETWCYNPRGLF